MELPKNIRHVHLVGICGTGMGSLAGLLVEAGFQVSGSDTAFYPPMGDQLKNLPIRLHEGFKAQNLKPKPDLVVIGNVASKNNEEAAAVLDQKLPYLSLPQALNHFFLQNKKALVVAGTHGKTTTSNLLAWVLTHAGLDPGFLIGGVGLNFGKSYHPGKGDYFVIEGDEYDTAFFDKRPKFVHYRPVGAILTSMEWDHVDIYPTFEKVLEAFSQFTQTIQPQGVLLAWEEIAVEAKAKMFRYGLGNADYCAKNIQQDENGTRFTLHYRGEHHPMQWPLTGLHNLENALGVIGVCHQLGIPWEKIAGGIATFQGVKRRQEILGEVNGVTVIDHFAHHPTAVRRTLQAIKARFPGRRLWAVFEPRSNTSRRNLHYKEYIQAFKPADRVILAGLYHPEKIPEDERLSPGRLADDMMRHGIDAYHIDKTPFIVEYILRGISHGDVVVFMSNGDFDNIHQKFLEKLPRSKILVDKNQVPLTKVRERH